MMTAPPQPFAIWNPEAGCWETSQLDLFGHSEPYSAIWPTSGTTRNGSAYPHRWPAPHITGSGSLSPRTAKTLFRTPLASDSSRGGETLEQVRARRGTIALSHQIIALALHGLAGSPDRSSEPETLGALVENIFLAGGDTQTRSPDGSTSPHDPAPPPPPAIMNEAKGPRPAPEFVEGLMGLPAGWVTDPAHDLTANQQNTALGNGVLPLQSLLAIESLDQDAKPR